MLVAWRDRCRDGRCWTIWGRRSRATRCPRCCARSRPAPGPRRAWPSCGTTTRPAIDLSVRAHREALLRFLRAWGCRHLRRDDTGRSSRALASWWRRFGPTLPLGDGSADGPGRRRSSRRWDGRTPPSRVRRPRSARAATGTSRSRSVTPRRPRRCSRSGRRRSRRGTSRCGRAFGWGRVEAEEYATFLAAVRGALIGLAERLRVRAVRAPRRARPPRELTREDRRRVPLDPHHARSLGVTHEEPTFSREASRDARRSREG